MAETRDNLEDKYKTNVEVKSKGKECKSDFKLLNEIIRRTEGGDEVEADPRHADIVITDLGLKGAKPRIARGIKDSRLAGKATKDMGKCESSSRR